MERIPSWILQSMLFLICAWMMTFQCSKHSGPSNPSNNSTLPGDGQNTNPSSLVSKKRIVNLPPSLNFSKTLFPTDKFQILIEDKIFYTLLPNPGIKTSLIQDSNSTMKHRVSYLLNPKSTSSHDESDDDDDREGEGEGEGEGEKNNSNNDDSTWSSSKTIKEQVDNLLDHNNVSMPQATSTRFQPSDSLNVFQVSMKDKPYWICLDGLTSSTKLSTSTKVDAPKNNNFIQTDIQNNISIPSSSVKQLAQITKSSQNSLKVDKLPRFELLKPHQTFLLPQRPECWTTETRKKQFKNEFKGYFQIAVMPRSFSLKHELVCCSPLTEGDKLVSGSFVIIVLPPECNQEKQILEKLRSQNIPQSRRNRSLAPNTKLGILATQNQSLYVKIGVDGTLNVLSLSTKQTLFMITEKEMIKVEKETEDHYLTSEIFFMLSSDLAEKLDNGKKLELIKSASISPQAVYDMLYSYFKTDMAVWKYVIDPYKPAN